MKTKILIAGVGGVGGYFGGLLASCFNNSDAIEINFLARGEHLKIFKNQGLTVLKEGADFIAKPFIASDNSFDFGVVDLIIITTKSYDLDDVILQLDPCIAKHTILLPLLNGVNSKERIKRKYPNNIVLEGCVYIVSRLREAGVVENIGNIETLFFGDVEYRDDKLIFFEKLMKLAGIQATLSQDILSIIWEKFIFLSPIATATSYYNRCIGDVISTSESLETIKLLIEEVKILAQAKGIIISKDITEKTLMKYSSLPYHTTSSMHNDFKNKKEYTELETLTGYIIKSAVDFGIKTPTYSKLYKILIDK
ncbi:2-dehydropantoate 2-reductase [Flavobacterium oreochromis]|uniref:ketopantoate reductase family protein n=1 Tax=Flavobacterium oreochromis TaxID=2906078 RepID=UPI000CDAB5E0|nr:hypothetical protein BWK58_15080 [Flavobacterium columnare]